MREPRIDDLVRLTKDIPELSLARGEVGVVRSTWCAPTVVYEVEFSQIGHDYQTRTLLRPEQIEVDADPVAGDVAAAQPEADMAWG